MAPVGLEADPDNRGLHPDGGDVDRYEPGRIGGVRAGLVQPTDRHQQPPDPQQHPSATSAGTARLEGVRS
jgi:hypothetical protein